MTHLNRNDQMEIILIHLNWVQNKGVDLPYLDYYYAIHIAQYTSYTIHLYVHVINVFMYMYKSFVSHWIPHNHDEIENSLETLMKLFNLNTN